jgi:hypothetical protein
MIVYSHTRSYAGLLSSLSSSDFYQFTLTAAQVVELGLQAAYGTATLVLFDASGTQFGSATAQSTADAAIEESLSAGTYYVDVTGNANAGYTLLLQTGAPATGTTGTDSAYGSIANALAIGQLGAVPQSFAGWVGLRDSDNFFAFSLAGPALLRLSLAGLEQNAVLFLRNVSDQQIGYAYAVPVYGGSIVQALGAGSYYIDVEDSGTTAATNTGYSLTVSAASLTDRAGHSLATALALGALGPGGQSVSGTIGPLDSSDDYGFTLASPSTVTLTLSGLTANASFAVFTPTGAQVGSGSGSTTQNGSIIEQLAAGSYIAAVQGGTATNYTLALTTAPQPTTGMPGSGGTGGTLATAFTAGTLGASPQSFSGTVTSAATDQFYRFVLTQSALISLQLSALSTGTYLRLLSASGGQIDNVYGSASSDASVVQYAAAGTYAADVSDYDGNTGYVLTMSAASSGDLGGPSATAAYAVGALAPPSPAPGDFNGDGTSDLLWRNAATGAVVDWSMNGGTADGKATLRTDPAWTVAGVADVTGNGTADILWRNSATGAAALWLMNDGTESAASVLTIPPGWTLAGAGDFTGNGTDDLLWSDAATGTVTEWIMANGAPVSSQVLATDSPWTVAGTGDFNGDGTTDILWRDAATGSVAIWLMNGGTESSGTGLLTDPAWTVAGTGDFTGDGVTDILMRNLFTGATELWLMNNGTIQSTSVLQTVPTWQVAGTGDFTGNGTDDILWRNTVTGAVTEWVMNNGTESSTGTLQTDPVWSVVPAATAAASHVVADIDGDGRSDVLWTNSNTGAVVLWELNGSTVVASAGLLSDPSWVVAGSGDFAGTGTSDILWRNAATGSVVAWEMSAGTATAGTTLLTDPAWTIAGTGDFNGDGKTDILWNNASTGQVVEWEMNGFAPVTAATLLSDPTWSVVGVGDFTGNGTDDILWQNKSTGTVVEWEMNNGTVSSASTLLNDPAWAVVGVGDFTGNGTDDILWRNAATGTVVEWLMNSGTVSSAATLLQDPAWTVVGVGDYGGTGTSDILWRNAGTGQVVEWQMNGSSIIAAAGLFTGTIWSPAPALLAGG